MTSSYFGMIVCVLPFDNHRRNLPVYVLFFCPLSSNAILTISVSPPHSLVHSMFFTHIIFLAPFLAQVSCSRRARPCRAVVVPCRFFMPRVTFTLNSLIILHSHYFSCPLFCAGVVTVLVVPWSFLDFFHAVSLYRCLSFRLTVPRRCCPCCVVLYIYALALSPFPLSFPSPSSMSSSQSLPVSLLASHLSSLVCSHPCPCPCLTSLVSDLAHYPVLALVYHRTHPHALTSVCHSARPSPHTYLYPHRPCSHLCVYPRPHAVLALDHTHTTPLSQTPTCHSDTHTTLAHHPDTHTPPRAIHRRTHHPCTTHTSRAP